MDARDDIEALEAYIKKRQERWGAMPKDAVQKEARDWLINLGTHRYNGMGEFVLTPEYGGPE